MFVFGLDHRYGGAACNKQHVGGADGEQSNSHDAGELIQVAFQFRGVGDGELVDVEDVVAVVGDATLTPDGAAVIGGGELAGDEGAGHGDDFDGEWELAQGVY